MTTTREHPSFNLLTILLWLLGNIIGFGFVGAGFHNFPLAFTFPPEISRLGGFRMEAALVGFFFGFIPALLIGLLQYLILRRRWPLSRWWIVTVSAGVGPLHFLSDGFENARDLSFAVLISGLLVSVFQWRLLRPHVPVSAWWIVVGALGWCIGWLIGIAILHNTGLLYRPWVPGLDGQQHGLLGLAVGTALSLSTGLMWLVRQRATAEMFSI
jgi:hypothetical protein